MDVLEISIKNLITSYPDEQFKKEMGRLINNIHELFPKLGSGAKDQSRNSSLEWNNEATNYDAYVEYPDISNEIYETADITNVSTA